MRKLTEAEHTFVRMFNDPDVGIMVARHKATGEDHALVVISRAHDDGTTGIMPIAVVQVVNTSADVERLLTEYEPPCGSKGAAPTIQ